VARRTAVNYARKMSVVARGKVRGGVAGGKSYQHWHSHLQN